MTLGQRFVRLVTDVVVRVPGAWRIFRPMLRRQFDELAPVWEGRARNVDGLLAALERLPAPTRVLDLGTGTGRAARLIAARYPEAAVTGADVAPKMIEQARALSDGRIRFDVADAQRLPYEDGAFDLVTLANMIPFFDELARVVAPGGHVAFSWSHGAGTPIYVAPDRLQRELGRRGFAEFAELSAGDASAFVARKQ